jgi:hypothetical protein
MSFTMSVGTKRFAAKTIERVVENFCRWRDSGASARKLDGTHWRVKEHGKVCGAITYAGTYYSKDSSERPPWVIVEEVVAKKGLSRAMGKSQEYKAGLRAALEWQYMRAPLECPHTQGTAQADAYIAGVEEVLGPLDAAGLEKLGESLESGVPLKLNGHSKEANRMRPE